MITEILADRIRWRGERFAIYDIHDLLPRHPNYPHGTDVLDPNTGKKYLGMGYYDLPDRKITTIVCHQTAGGYGKADKQVFNTAQFLIRDPKWKPNPKYDSGKPAGPKNLKYLWTGEGRGWPGFCYTWIVPFEPIVWEDLWLVWQTQDLNTVSFHTSGLNKVGGGLGFQGYFLEPEAGIVHPLKGTDGSPSDAQLQIYEEFWISYAQPVLGATILTGHWEHGKPSCPGQVLREKTIELRG